MTMSIFAPAPQPKSNLGFHGIVPLVARLKVSPLCLGAMNFSKAWESLMGECSKEDSFKALDASYHLRPLGTNYITKTLLTTYTAHATCGSSIVTVTASSNGWDERGS